MSSRVNRCSSCYHRHSLLHLALHSWICVGVTTFSYAPDSKKCLILMTTYEVLFHNIQAKSEHLSLEVALGLSFNISLLSSLT